MARDFSADYDIDFDVYDENGEEILTIIEASCFSDLTEALWEDDGMYKVKIYNTSCRQTKDYYDFYLNYLIKAFRLKHCSIRNTSFTFGIYNGAKDKHKMKEVEILALVSCVRYLWEGRDLPGRRRFFKYLKEDYDKTGKSNLQTIMKAWGKSNQEYVNKIHEFCRTEDIIPKTLGALRKWNDSLNEFSTFDPKAKPPEWRVQTRVYRDIDF